MTTRWHKGRRRRLFPEDDGEDGAPMAEGAEEHKDVPDGMEVPVFVVREEVGACRIEHSLGKEERKGENGEAFVDGTSDE